VVDNFLFIWLNGRYWLRGAHFLVKVKRKNSSEDIGVRLLKLLLLRFYQLYSEIPLRWYEMLISAVLGVLMGLGLGVVICGVVRAR